ncbi:MAG: alpha-1,2-fucosyltransferase [Lachnospiraceae bacterium]|nr:alpha-1,2-fucosyltransferase [Lachnospiraceae bacterium]
MIIIEVMGGLGNQMQQYALYQKMKHLGKDVKLDISWFVDEQRQEGVLARRKLELEYFTDLPIDICTKEEKERLVGKDTLFGKLMRKILPGQIRRFTESDIYHPEIFEFEDMYLSGYWACEKYYADILPELRCLFKFPEFGEMPVKKAGNNQECECSDNKVNKQNCVSNVDVDKNCQTISRMQFDISVSVHVRRGDYLDPANQAMFGGICTEAYYDAAIQYVLERYPDAHFYVFSDDTAYVREKYCGPQYTIVDWNTGENSFFDIKLMSCCKHNICANSTFSFWGARLNSNEDKIMVRPAKHKNSQQIIPKMLHELWGNWVIVDGDGGIV